jgi:hypothetical protein
VEGIGSKGIVISTGGAFVGVMANAFAGVSPGAASPTASS